MAVSRRHRGLDDGEGDEDGVAVIDGEDDDKLQKGPSQAEKGVFRKFSQVCACLASSFLLACAMSASGDALERGSAGTGNREDYDLYPFLVSADADAKLDRLPSQPLPNFPTNPRLEECTVKFKPSELPRTEAEWRPPFWMPAFPGSGTHDPSRGTSVLKELTEGLVGAAGGVNPVKNFHASMRGRLKHCRGISETVGCTCAHPMTSSSPERRTGGFRRGAILAVRNPAAAVPVFFAYKHVAYHGGEKQAPEEAWREMRDQHWAAAFADWLAVLKFWRGAADGAGHYHTALYLPYEDMVTTDAARGVAAVGRLAEALGGGGGRNATAGDAFATASSPRDHECLWYRAARREWEHQQEIVGDYVPAYTRAQKDTMVQDLRAYAAEVEGALVRGGSDAALVALLRRYADQIEVFVRVE